MSSKGTIWGLMLFAWNKFSFIAVILIAGIASPGILSGAEETKKSSTQQVGGLLFDVDEGVKIEQGPGGSVYLKSNREHMEQKFKEIDQRFENLESRVKKLEAAAASGSKKEDSEGSPGGRRVLITGS